MKSMAKPVLFIRAALITVLALGVGGSLVSDQPVIAESMAVTPLPPVEQTDGQAGACYSNYYEHGNRPFLPLLHAAGVRHDRVDFRWPVIEPKNDRWDFGPYDELVADELAQGVDLVGILQWTPAWAATGTQWTALTGPPQRPPGWYAPIVQTRSSSVPLMRSVSSAVPSGLYLPWDDPGNHWGDFVFRTVSRYSDTVRVWEMWNEPDGVWGAWRPWDGSPADYARLLKVGYQAAKAANPDATVLFGGLMYWADPTFFERVLDVLNDDPTAPANNYFFDVMSVHFYSRSSDAYDKVNHVRSRMMAYVPDHPIWLTETGVPVYDGAYPGLRTDFSATEAEAAAYLVQSYANALAADVQRYHWFRAHDGDMAEHFGLTHDETYLRPAYVAYQVATTYLISPTFVTRESAGPYVQVTLWGTPRGRVSVLWNQSPTPGVHTLPAVLDAATVVDRWGNTRSIAATDNVYALALGGATSRRSSDPSDYIIGGAPLIVVEAETPNQPPTSMIHPLPEITYSPSFTVSWEGQDNQSGVWFYDVQVRDGDGAWEYLYRSTEETSGRFTGQHGHTYYFRSRAMDRLGNQASWPEEPQAHTTMDLSISVRVSIGAFFADEDRDDVWDMPPAAPGETALTSVLLRFIDQDSRDLVSPVVGSAWEVTTTVYAGQTYRLWTTSGGYMRLVSFPCPRGGEVVTYIRDALGLWPVSQTYLPLLFRPGE